MVQASPLKPKMIAIVGPTAVGKSTLACTLTGQLNGAVINFDSQQVYRQLNIGTGKLPLNERNPNHYLLDLLDLDETMSAGDFAERAKKQIEPLLQEKILPILVGGTGLYLKSILYGLDNLPKRNSIIRNKLNTIIKSKGLNNLYAQLKQVDPSLAKKIQLNDQARIIRFLEIYELTQKPPSHLLKQQQISPYDCFILGLNLPRPELHHAIAERIEAMLQAGWQNEVEGLMQQGYDFEKLSATAIGYCELQKVIQNKISLNDAKQAILIQTRQYAKRQITWFKKEKINLWINPNSEAEIAQAIEQIKTFLIK
ncbi:MAG: tRNA (adenosine(37)-N6)-dimethylallyltransferase MiaA [Deltaproteobacteria bacterium]|nr:tRNA (adenosine(37)-N6)-dimethylallyltransferase MiaA [Deltaproteobacteria bacterium]